MRHKLATVFVVLALVAALALGAAARELTPAGSFLKYRATSISELTSQVASETAVRTRYAKHFDTSPQIVAEYFAHNLKLVSLDKPLKVQMWYVSKDGSIQKKDKLLPKGTTVFASKDGTPLLSWSCGNPMQASLPIMQAKKTGSAPAPAVGAAAPPAESAASASAKEPTTQEALEVAKAAAAAAESPAQTEVLAAPVETAAAAAVVAPPAPAAAAAVPVAAPVVVDAAAVPAVAAPPPAAAAGGSSLNLAWIGGLAGLAGAVALASGGGGGSDAGPAAEPVPEPGTLLMLGSLLAGAGTLKWRLRRARR